MFLLKNKLLEIFYIKDQYHIVYFILNTDYIEKVELTKILKK